MVARMNLPFRAYLSAAALAGFLAVALDALGAHALGPSADPARVRLLELATHYQLVHALALVGVAALAAQASTVWLRVSAWAFAIGIVLFCGGLALRALTQTTALSFFVPVGGTALMLGWLALLVHALRARGAG
jgi:uncharacterized membrane protein YgdD (TMEM256/DUF423 family)